MVVSYSQLYTVRYTPRGTEDVDLKIAVSDDSERVNTRKGECSRDHISQRDQWLLDLRLGFEPVLQNAAIDWRNADKFATGGTAFPGPADTRLNIDFSLGPRQQEPEV